MPYCVISAMGYLLSQNIDFQNAWQFWVLKSKPIDFHWFKNGPDILLLIVIIIFVLTGMLQIIGSYFRSNVETRRSKLAMLVLTSVIVEEVIVPTLMLDNW